MDHLIIFNLLYTRKRESSTSAITAALRYLIVVNMRQHKCISWLSFNAKQALVLCDASKCPTFVAKERRRSDLKIPLIATFSFDGKKGIQSRWKTIKAHTACSSFCYKFFYHHCSFFFLAGEQLELNLTQVIAQ